MRGRIVRTFGAITMATAAPLPFSVDKSAMSI
jgi:hypothetical protein